MRGNGVTRVLVYFGGNDQENLTGKALEALTKNELAHLNAEIVVGEDNPHMEILGKQVKRRPGTRLHVQPTGFIELILRADLCIGAGGTTTWERLCLGVPSVVITVAKNQEAFTAELDKADYVMWVGRKEEVGVKDIEEGVIKAIEKIQKNRSLDLTNMVDGLGALRVAESLTSL
jgi:spore coat polysaccharide biosynthesis predicted glycosyltransferase SpsG